MLVSLVLAVAAGAASPVPIEIAEGKDHYFGADAHSSASYLHLMADGRYVVIDAQHMFTEIDDEGRWRSDGHGVVLESDHSVRNIEVGDFRVYIFDRCGEDTLPELRASAQALIDAGGRVAVGDDPVVSTRRSGHPLGRGPDKVCGASLSYSPDDHPAKPFRASRLRKVIAAIDAWLADAEAQNIFEYRAWDYRGERFLEPVRPGMHAVQESAEDVRREMDEGGGLAPYVYYAMSAEDYAQEANCTYAFKFFPQLNAPCND